MEIRKPYVAGQFYENDKGSLKKQLEKAFEHQLGPGLPDKTKNYGSVRGAVVPHAGIMFSGMCAAHSYKAIRESGEYDTFVLIGFSHGQLESNQIVTTNENWETPMGVVHCDTQLVDELVKDERIVIDKKAMQYEHSIEVQLPFLQYLYSKPQILPLLVSQNCDFAELAKEINKVITKFERKVCCIASSDFTHYGPSFGFVPFEKDVKKNIFKLDQGAIEEIKILSVKGFLDYLQSTAATICGRNSIALLLELLTNNVNRIELLKYYTSGDLLDDYTNSVSYASIIFEEISL
ncbi:MAG: AmmeMemoRadiSam system protein B [Nanobdellota archaeon]